MSIKPIDIMRSQEISQIKQVEYTRMQNEQAQLGKEFQNHLQQKNERPNDVSESENPEFLYDAKNKGNNEYNQNKGNKKKKKQSQNTKKPIRPGSFDVSI